MPKPDEPKPPPVSPPLLPPDFPDIPQNAPSALQPPTAASARPDKVEGTAQTPTTSETLRRKNARLREKINGALHNHPELRDVVDLIALEQGSRVRVGMPFLERVNADLQERARAIIERRPDLEHLFDDA
jgi:hypothetical protein